MRWALCSMAFVAACASATVSTDKPIDAGNDHDSSISGPPIDAPVPIDAPAPATLSETVNSTMVYGNSIGCISQDGNNTMSDTTWYRAYQLSDYSITGPFHVQSIGFSVQEAAGNPTYTISIGSYAGAIGGATIDPSMITQIATTTLQIPATSGMTGEDETVPLVADLAAGSKLVVEISIPQQSGKNHYAFLGATTAGETHPGYYSSTGCTTALETTIAAGGTGQIIMNVVGTH